MEKACKGMSAKRIEVLVSSTCNNNCYFCCDRVARSEYLRFNSYFLARYGAVFLDRPNFLKQVENATRVSDILFTGGEPTLNDNLTDFIAVAKERGYRKIALQTNGRRLCYIDYCFRLLENGLNHVHVALHGSTRKYHDHITRSPGSFFQVVRGLENMKFLKKNFDFKMSVNFVINRLNIRNIGPYIDFVLSKGFADEIVFKTLMYCGNVKAYQHNLLVSLLEVAKEFKAAVRLCEGSNRMVTDRIRILNMPLCLLNEYEHYAEKNKGIPSYLSGNSVKPMKRCSDFLKRKDCKYCCFDLECCGIDRGYIKMNGWDEFVPAG